jgi:acyl carrier protein
MLDRETIRRTLIRLLEEETGETYPVVGDSASLREQLGLDSVDVMSVVMQVEKTFHIRLTMGQMQGLVTVGDVLNLLQAQTAAMGRRAAAA